MKKQILISLISLSSILTVNAQTWNGSTSVDGNIWRNGNVGIGTSSPVYKISLGGQTGQVTTPLAFAFSNDYSNNSLAANSKLFLFNAGGAEIYGIGVGGNADIQYHAGGTGNTFGRHDFYSGNSLKLTIQNNGNIGIGTSSPVYKISFGGQTGQVTTPLAFAFSNDYSNNSLAANSKLFLFNAGGAEVYGIGVGGNADIQYHAGGTGNTFGRHDFYSGNSLKLTIRNNGNIGIGTSSPTYKLDVCGTIRAKEVKVDLLGGCDFVFKKDYKLMSLNDLEKFVTTKQHLPEIASEKEMIENGLNMKEFQMKLLQKVEELTLYTIKQNKQLEKQNDKIEKQNQEFKILKAKIKKLESNKK